MEVVHLAQMYAMRSSHEDKDLAETNLYSIRLALCTANFDVSVIESARDPSP